jgi:pSer/pThr/pTyr-binding forkhead associated (FHA) protein
MESLETGTLPGTGSFRCLQCDYVLSLAAFDELPPCPACGSREFARASLFSQAPSRRHPDEDSGAWIAAARTGLTEAGTYLAWQDGAETSIVPLTGEWTRIGRSLAADIRFDDPTVSRRHALIVRGPDGVRVLDDRSLNGVFVNGRRVEWSALADGDEVLVGRHALRFLDVPAVSGMREGAADGGEPVVRTS